jgi:superoxide reductase
MIYPQKRARKAQDQNRVLQHEYYVRKEGDGMTKIEEVYLCKICGNKVKVLEAGKGTLVCCGKPMILVK